MWRKVGLLILLFIWLWLRTFSNVFFIYLEKGRVKLIKCTCSALPTTVCHNSPGFFSLNFIRLLQVVFSSQHLLTEGVITTRSNRMKFRLRFFGNYFGNIHPKKSLVLKVQNLISIFTKHIFRKTTARTDQTTCWIDGSYNSSTGPYQSSSGLLG